MQTLCLSVEEASYIQKTLPRVLDIHDMTIMETDMLKESWSIIQKVINGKEAEVEKRGLLILEPAGTGKTTALIYLLQKLNLGNLCVDVFTIKQ